MLGYHSALTKPREAEQLKVAHVGPSWACTHDIRLGLPAAYDLCDVFYTDLPRQGGFKVFEKRAGITERRDNPEFLFAVSAIIQKPSAPVVLVASNLSQSSLPVPSHIHETRPNGVSAVARPTGRC